MKRTTLAVLAAVLVAVALVPMDALADETLKFNAQVRHRFEVDNKDFNSDTGIKSFNLLRTRVGATFMPSQNVKAFVQFQDSRVWGEEPGTLAPVDNIDYVAIADPDTLLPVDRIERPVMALVAARVGQTRLIDNLRIG